MPRFIEGVGNIFTAKELSEKSGVSQCTIMRHFRKKKLKGRRLGRQVFFLDAEIKSFLSGNDGILKTEPAADPAAGKIETSVDETLAKVKIKGKARKKNPIKEQKEVIDITRAMNEAGNLRAVAAEKLKISRNTLHIKIKKYGLFFPKNQPHPVKNNQK